VQLRLIALLSAHTPIGPANPSTRSSAIDRPLRALRKAVPYEKNGRSIIFLAVARCRSLN